MRAKVKTWLLANAILASGLIHGALFGGALGYIHWKETRDHYMEIDLSGQSLLARLANPEGRSRAARPPEPWVFSDGKRLVAAPKPLPPDQTPPPAEDESAGPPCPAPCPDNAGDWLPASAVSRKPNWTRGIITEDDYPRDLRRAGKEGKVVVDVLIDAGGNVRGVSLVQGSEAQFNDLVLERLKQSKFRPAYDNNGDAVACKLRLPIAFELR